MLALGGLPTPSDPGARLPLIEPRSSHGLLQAPPCVCLDTNQREHYLHPFFLMMFPRTTSALQETRHGDFMTVQRQQIPPPCDSWPLGPLGGNVTGPESQARLGLGSLSRERSGCCSPAEVAPARVPADFPKALCLCPDKYVFI